MKKVFIPILTFLFLSIAAMQQVNAQTPYRTAIGLGIDLGDGETLFGPQIKHSFGGNNAGNAQVLFGDNITVIGADYSYNEHISGTDGLSWYVGFGPQIAFVDHGDWDDDNSTYFAIRPAVGLEFRIPSTPLAMHFDWKPWWNLTNNSHFEPSRFSLGFKFALK